MGRRRIATPEKLTQPATLLIGLYMFKPDLQQVQTVLCLGAHSDDIEIGCGGTLMELLSQKPQVDIHWIVLSGGGQRAEEAQQSASRFLSRSTGLQDVRLFEYRDSYFPTHWTDIKNTFHALSRDIQPDLIFTHRGDDAHQDHRVVSELTWCTFRNHLVLEYEIAKYEGDLGQPNIYFPISEATAQTKCDLLTECFPTQAVKPWFDEETFRAMLRLRGLECNSASRYAEAFHCRKMSLSVERVDRIPETSGSLHFGASHVDHH